MADTPKELVCSISVSGTITKNAGKILSCGIDAGPTIIKNAGKKLLGSVDAGAYIQKASARTLTANVSALALKQVNTATLTVVNNGNYEVGLGAENGAKFTISVYGTFTAFTIAVNGNSLTYTESVTAQTIIIDNVNATVKNGSTNKLSKLTGDVSEFLKLLPGDNQITFSKTGGSVDFTIDFRPQYI
jgi:hypothetical protein